MYQEAMAWCGAGQTPSAKGERFEKLIKTMMKQEEMRAQVTLAVKAKHGFDIQIGEYLDANSGADRKRLESLGVEVTGRRGFAIGIDAVITLVGSDKYIPVQIKYVSSRDGGACINLTTFYDVCMRSGSLSFKDRVASMLVITNCAFKSKLPVIDGEALERSLADSPPLDLDRRLCAGQEEVIRQARERLDSIGRALLHLPPGYGKTRCAIEVACGYDKIVWCVPQVPLHAQTLAEFKEYTGSLYSKQHHVGSMSRGTRQTKTIRSWNKEKRRIVFCIYKSLPLLLEAGLSVDLFVMDEAHRKECRDSIPLLQGKALFLSATPGTKLPQLVGEGTEVRRTFTEAVMQDRVSDFLMYALIDPGPSDKRTAKVSLVRQALQEGHWSKMMAFTHTHESSARYAEALKIALPDAEVLCDSGDMSDEERRAVMACFSASEGPVLFISVRLYLEGMDVKGCDSVCFLEPVASARMIVQGVGRATRFARRKIAKVIVPASRAEYEEEGADYGMLFETLDKIDGTLEGGAESRLVVARASGPGGGLCEVLPEELDYKAVVAQLFHRKALSLIDSHRLKIRHAGILSRVQYGEQRQSLGLPESPQKEYGTAWKGWNYYLCSSVSPSEGRRAAEKVQGVTWDNMRDKYEELVMERKAPPEPPGPLAEVFGLEED